MPLQTTLPPRHPSLPPTLQTPTRPRLLLVDDIPLNLQVVQRILSREAVDVVACSSASEALVAAREHDFDLVLTDIHMPEMDGIALVKALARPGLR